MAIFLLGLLVVTAGAMIAWGLWERDRIYQFPTLAGVAWLGYIVPQAIGVLNNSRSVPRRVLLDGGLELALFMSALCRRGPENTVDFGPARGRKHLLTDHQVMP